MNWKLIFYLSLFGLIMAFATISWVPEKTEPVFWLIIFVICAYWVAKKCPGKYFLNGFMISLVNSVWITAAHIIFYSSYLSHHPSMAQMNQTMPMADSPRLMMLIMGPVFGAVSGLVLGLFCFIASKFVGHETT